MTSFPYFWLGADAEADDVVMAFYARAVDGSLISLWQFDCPLPRIS